ncbi:MAG TPA: transglutaminase family protein [Xanthobacteraceae bacterium]|jgi:transglutaminase-like putative cysteine protease|nr:transglutaminase family protein [Xanthobacteraceae bacterium]
MRIHIAHRNIYHYDPPATGVIQVLRLTPRNYEGQYVANWRIDVSADARLAAHEDAFGNITHTFSADGPFAELVVEIDGEVETHNTNGIVRGTVERFGPSLFLRDTALTQADPAIRGFAHSTAGAKDAGVLAQLHALLDRLHDEMDHEADDAPGAANAAEAFARKGGPSRDLSHIFISAAHALDIPARYVGGYYRNGDGVIAQPAAHAWVEASVPDLGWVAFDPANGFCPTEGHVRVAVGLDALGAAPVRGMRYGAGAETLAVAIKVGQ